MPKAVRFEEYGGVEVLNVVEVPMPESGPGQVLVKANVAELFPCWTPWNDLDSQFLVLAR